MDEVVGNPEARAKLGGWLVRWKRGGKAALLVGPPGTGKTTAVHLLAGERGLNLVELNASDTRTKLKLTEKLGEVVHSTGLFGEKALVFLDEVDGLAGRADYGAVEFIKDMVRKSANPVVMAANDPDADELRKLASVTVRIEFKPLDVKEMLVLLRKVAKEESMAADDAQLFEIADASKGDIRYALNALQSGAAGLKDQELTASNALQSFLDAPDREAAIASLRAYPNQPRDLIRELAVCVSRASLTAEKRAAALDALSRADLLLGRMIRGKDWRLLRYLDAILATGVKEALEGEGVRYTPDSVPWPLQLRIWNDSKKIREMGALAGKSMGISGRGWVVEDFPFISLLCFEKRFRAELVRSLNLDETFETFLAKESARRFVGARRTGGP
ncbi:MAG: AAA family ATPase [Nitrososphaerota archaeon]|nr:AAA family ATPase [Nitrososphaerota archaeon]